MSVSVVPKNPVAFEKAYSRDPRALHAAYGSHRACIALLDAELARRSGRPVDSDLKALLSASRLRLSSVLKWKAYHETHARNLASFLDEKQEQETGPLLQVRLGAADQLRLKALCRAHGLSCGTVGDRGERIFFRDREVVEATALPRRIRELLTNAR